MCILIWILCFLEAVRNGAGALAAQPIVHDARNGGLQYELFMVQTSFLGAMSTCQSRAGGRGVLSPLATKDDIDAIAEIIVKSCFQYNDWNDEYFLVGLTSLGHLPSLGFLDRPHPGSSTSLLSTLALPGAGFQNSYWPDAANTSSASSPVAVLSSTTSTGSNASMLSNISAVQPLCAAVRVVLIRPATSSLNSTEASQLPSTVDLFYGSTSNNNTHVQLIPACSDHFRQLYSEEGQLTVNNTYRLEVNIINCDGKMVTRPNGTTNNSNVMDAEVGSLHAFVCRVPVNTTHVSSPSPSSSPSYLPPAAPAPASAPPATEWPPSQTQKLDLPPSLPSPHSLPPSPAPLPPSLDPPSPTQQTTALPTPQQPSPPQAQETLPPPSSRRTLTGMENKGHVLLQTSAGVSGPPSPGPASSQKAPKPPWPLPPNAQPPTTPPTAPLGPLSATTTPIGQRCDELSLSTPVAPTGPVDKSTDEGAGGGAWRYLACHVPISWSEAAALCEGLLAGGSLAVWESQAQMDVVAKLLVGKDLVGSFGFWYGLVSGIHVNPTANLSTFPLEYILTDPRASPSYMSQLWTRGTLTVHAACRENLTSPAASSLQSPPSSPFLPNSSNTPSLSRPLQPSTTKPPPSSSPIPIPQPNVQQSTPVTMSVPHSSGCCGTLIITPPSGAPGDVDYSPSRFDLQLRLCHEPMSFICQAPYESSVSAGGTAAPPTHGSVSPSTSGAMNLLAGLFLDALSATYSGDFRMFRAVTQLRLEGTTADVIWGASGGSGSGNQVWQRLVNETLQELTVATRLPSWSFALQGPTHGSTVLPLNITVRSLPRATLDNFAELLTTFVVSRPEGDLLNPAYRGAWGVQAYSVQIITLEELSSPAPPPAPAISHAVPIRTLLLIACTIGGSMVGFGILTALILRRHWQHHRRSTTVYTMGTDSSGELLGTAPKFMASEVYDTHDAKPSLTLARSTTPVNVGRWSSSYKGWTVSNYSSRAMGLGAKSETAADVGTMTVAAAANGAGSMGFARGPNQMASLLRTESGGSVGRATTSPNGLSGPVGVERSWVRPSPLEVSVIGVGSLDGGVTTTSPYNNVGVGSLRPTPRGSARGLLVRGQSVQSASQVLKDAEGAGGLIQVNTQE